MNLKILIFLGLLFLIQAQKLNQTGTVYYDKATNTYTYKADILDADHGAAIGVFQNTLNVTGWGVLDIKTNSQFDDYIQMYAAGYLEGVLTAGRIFEQYQNMYAYFFKTNPPTDKVLNFLSQQDQFTRSMVQQNQNDKLWYQVGSIMSQFDGLVAGYHQTSLPNIGVFGFQLLNGVGDFLDLNSALNEDLRKDWKNMSFEQIKDEFHYSGHCSALIKVTGDYSDIFAAHSSWFTYASTNRIYKHYNFQLNQKEVAAKRTSFSSYPGFLESLDDFYIMDSGLAMIQTTNNIFDQTLYEKVLPESLFAWQRVRLANTLAKTGQEWFELVSQYNSGTYNNQYMVLNYGQFSRYQPLKNGTLWVVEQIPGLVLGEDVTNILEHGYWPSYNIPYFEQIYNMSGYPEFYEKFGNTFNYQLYSRAEIFRRDQTNVRDIESLKYIMRYNDFQHDPYQEQDPMQTICSRGDLKKNNSSPGGCYDSKVTDLTGLMNLRSYAINGPTYQNQEVFRWTDKFNNTVHVGTPSKYDFDFVKMEPLQLDIHNGRVSESDFSQLIKQFLKK